MLSVAIELQTTCTSCGGSVPINACADSVACRCGAAIPLDDERWQSLLRDTFAEAARMDRDEGQRSLRILGGVQFALMYGRQVPRCGTCKHPVDLARNGACPCGRTASIRPAPPALAACGVQLLVGEDPEQIAGANGAVAIATPRASQPVALFCPQCRGGLTVDGSQRLVRCGYCSVDVYLPDDLWQRLHPVATVARWYACMPEEALRSQEPAWARLIDAVLGPDHLIYLRDNESRREHFLRCVGPDAQLRWERDLPEEFRDDDSRRSGLALDARAGRLYIWRRGKHSLGIFSAADGSLIGQLGGKEPTTARTHVLDLESCSWLGVDIDGTILARIAERFVRFAADGTPLPTWPPRSTLMCCCA